jgi:hypothetical protein
MDDFLPPDQRSIFYQDSTRYYRDKPVSQELQEKLQEERARKLREQREQFEKEKREYEEKLRNGEVLNETPQNQPTVNGIVLEPTPNATGALIAGILAVVLSLIWCKWYGTVAGILSACVALYLSNSGMQMVRTSPTVFSNKGMNSLWAGRILGIIALCIGAISFIILIIYFMYVSEQNL